MATTHMQGMPRVTSLAPQFLVDDLTRSIAYYERLGFTFGEPWRGIYAIGLRDGLELHLKQAPKCEAERQHRREHDHLDAAAGVDGIETFYEHCITNALRVVKPLAPTPWGTKDFYIEDPDGYIIAFGGSPSGLMTERAVPILPGDDLIVAKEFYVGKLGFTVQWEASADGKNGIMGLARGSIELTIDCPMTGHGRNACVSLLVNSADAYYEEWRHKVDFKRPPQDETWNARTCGVADPFGNTIFVIGPASQTGASPR